MDNKKKRLAIICTHPIQYNDPLFKLISDRKFVELKVFYTWSQSKSGLLYDPGFKIERKWDIPLLIGYEYEFIRNISPKPGSHHFWGIINFNLIKNVNQYNPDFVIIYGWSFYSHIISIIYYNIKTKVGFRGDSTLLDEKFSSNVKNKLRRFFLKTLFKFIDVSFYVGQNNLDYFLIHGLDPKQLIYAPHAIDNDRFTSEVDKASLTFDNLIKMHKINNDDIIFLFVGKIEEKKNPIQLIKTFMQIQNKNVKLLIIGDGPLKVDAEKISESDNRITFAGFQNQGNIINYYALSDVVILPSKGPGETWGLVLNEAMCQSKVVIASNQCGGSRDLIIDGFNGWVYQHDDESQLENILNNCIKIGKVGLTKIGINSRKHIDNFTFERIAIAYENECLK